MDQTRSVKEHYEKHLGRLYSWMIGDFGALVARQKEEFAGFKIAYGQDGGMNVLVGQK